MAHPLSCARCGHEYPDRKRGSESEALMFRVMDAVAQGESEKLYFCDERCYRKTSAYAKVRHSQKRAAERAAKSAVKPRFVVQVDEGEESGSEV